LPVRHHRYAPADALLLEDARRFRREPVRRDARELRDHDLAHGEALHAVAFLQHAAQVAVGEDPEQAVVRVDDARHADALARHLVQRRGQQRVGGAVARQLRALAHDVRDVHEEAAAQRAARVMLGELLAAEAARFQQRHRERVAQRQRRGGARRGRQVERARFLVDAGIQVHVRLARERGIRAARDGDDLRAAALDERQDARDLVGLPRIRNGDDHVVGRDHAQVAVARLGRMHEERRSAGGSERGRDLVAHMARLAHARHDDPSLRGEDHAVCGEERFAEARLQVAHRGGFDLEHLAREIEKPFRLGDRVRL
jgi:hypothetical protein